MHRNFEKVKLIEIPEITFNKVQDIIVEVGEGNSYISHFQGYLKVDKTGIIEIKFIDCKFVRIDFGDIIFANCRFERVEFSDCTFGSVSFENSIFESVKFAKCILKEEIILSDQAESSFRGCKFIDSRLIECDFTDIYVRHCNFDNVTFRDCNLFYSRFMDCEFHIFKIIKCNMSSMDFLGNSYASISFLNCELDENTKFHLSEDESNKNFERMYLLYNQVYKLFRLNGLNENASEYFYESREFERKSSTGFKKIGLLFLKLLWGYGERPWNVVGSCIVTITFYSFLYLICGINISGTTIYADRFNDHLFINFLKCLYFSTITFTTVGYGDISPSGGASMFLSATEALLGVFFIAVATASIYRKLSKS